MASAGNRHTHLRRSRQKGLGTYWRFPRRVYLQRNFAYVVEVILEVWQRREALTNGLMPTYEAPFPRHFAEHLEPA